MLRGARSACCRRQAWKRSKDNPDYKTISFFRVDYDAQKDVVNKLNAPRSTLIAYRGGKEVARESWGPSQGSVAELS